MTLPGQRPLPLRRAAGAAIRRRLAIALLLPVLAACATGGNPRDPFEAINRPIFAFNDAIDQNALRPIASGYRKVVPEPVRQAVGNVFGNIADLYIGLNNLLQAKPRAAFSDVTRFLVNSTLGIGGLADVASDFGLRKHQEDFGQTLGRWGVPAGPYLMLPLLGPSTMRDAPTIYVDGKADPLSQYDHSIALRNSLYGLRVVDNRAQLLDAERLLSGAALDRYALIRDGYLQRRRNAVYDGEPPDDDPGLDDDSGYGNDDFYKDDPTKDEPAPGEPARNRPAGDDASPAGSAPAAGGGAGPAPVR